MLSARHTRDRTLGARGTTEAKRQLSAQMDDTLNESLDE